MTGFPQGHPPSCSWVGGICKCHCTNARGFPGDTSHLPGWPLLSAQLTLELADHVGTIREKEQVSRTLSCVHPLEMNTGEQLPR